MESPQRSSQSPVAENQHLLPFGSQQSGSTRRRSTSLTPSMRSGHSHVTIVDKHSDIPEPSVKTGLKRKCTQKVEIKLSRWKCFLGLFNPRFTERAAVATANVPEMEDDGEDIDNQDYFKITAQVLPSDKAGNKAHQHARCTLDSGCEQGNLVSIEFARKLGYTASDFKPLRSREQLGATSMTGDVHIPEGVLYLSWYHHESPRLFQNMRFLVSPYSHFDLVIGARSLAKHKLLLPHSFGLTTVVVPSDKELNNIRSDIASLVSKVRTLELELSELKENPGLNTVAIQKYASNIAKMKREKDIKSLELELYETQKNTSSSAMKRSIETINSEIMELKIKSLEIDLSEAKEKLAKQPKSLAKKSAVEKIKIELDEAKAKSVKSEATTDNPDIKVSEPNGTTRAPTGLSARFPFRRTFSK